MKLLALFGAEVWVAVPAEQFGFGFFVFFVFDEGVEDVWGEVVAGEAVFGGVAGLVFGVGFGDFVEDWFVDVFVTEALVHGIEPSAECLSAFGFLDLLGAGPSLIACVADLCCFFDECGEVGSGGGAELRCAGIGGNDAALGIEVGEGGNTPGGE